MSTIEQGVEVQVPVTVAYNQWTQFEEFPSFMDGVQSVVQQDDTHLHWTARVAGVKKEWDAVVTEQIPDERVAWKSIDGTANSGVVTFHRIADDVTKVMLQLDVQPDGVLEEAGDMLGLIKHQAVSDLERFKTFIEERGHETGEWRGRVTRLGSN